MDMQKVLVENRILNLINNSSILIDRLNKLIITMTVFKKLILNLINDLSLLMSDLAPLMPQTSLKTLVQILCTCKPEHFC